MQTAEIIAASSRYVSVKEGSGLVSIYHNWSQFFARTDSDQLCVAYIKKCRDIAELVTRKMVIN